MALRGNLRDFSFTQLLNLISLASKTGTLVVEGPTKEARVAFQDGKLAFASIGNDNGGLAYVLHRAHKLSNSQYRSIQARATRMGDKELGLLLINGGYVTQDDILQNLQAHITGIVRILFTWVEGLFRFDSGLPPPADRIHLRLDLEDIIVEGSRQLREWEQLLDEIPSLDVALKFTERTLTHLHLTAEEWAVVRYVDPKNSLQQIAVANRLSELEVRRIVYSLLQAGLVVLVRKAGGPPAVNPRMFATTDRAEQRSLLNKLIDRIRAI